MLRAEAEITLDERVPYEAGASFLSYLAYPDHLDQAQRQHFFHALCRHYINRQSERTCSWAEQPQWIRPAHLRLSESELHRSMTRGYTKIYQRTQATSVMLYPLFLDLEISEISTKKRNVNALAAELAVTLGSKPGSDSASTVKSRVWRPTKMVAPAAIAWDSWARVHQRKHDENDPLEAFMNFPKAVELAVELANRLLPQLLAAPRFKMSAEETVKFTFQRLSEFSV